ncbi:MAG: DUF177 domain-containing protein [Deltaproteobacteria bacterium]|nr:DUF177 domain-containing protein [Deltaproteobacteria bacterium]
MHYSEQDAWLVEVVKNIQESEITAKPAYTVDFELRKLQEVVFLKSKVHLELGLLCSRCAKDFGYDLQSRFQCMFTRDKTLDGSASGANVGVAHSEPTGATGEDLDIEFLEKDYIELADVLKEQIYLKLPFQPLCSEGCKGICPVCGQDQNTQPCQCHRIKNPALANALKNFRVN